MLDHHCHSRILALKWAMLHACRHVGTRGDASDLMPSLATWLKGAPRPLISVGSDALLVSCLLPTPAGPSGVQGVQKVSKYYHPFGTYHFILGAEIRTPPGSATARSCSGACSPGWDLLQAQYVIIWLPVISLRRTCKKGAEGQSLSSQSALCCPTCVISVAVRIVVSCMLLYVQKPSNSAITRLNDSAGMGACARQALTTGCL